ncbi:unnamed protein product [Pocillopora meandrina]|uniref:Uncharacterized protein n=1 Tax=Pocillopora meandrina TaxID=46732 RepID=A0AAU9VXW8_9CNID|nr:unnamed protein product [Pocillopora meandrina]
MEPLLADYGSPSKATVYTAFAAKENESDVVQIQLNGRGLVDVLVNGERVFIKEEILCYTCHRSSMLPCVSNVSSSVPLESKVELLGLQSNKIRTLYRVSMAHYMIEHWSAEFEGLRFDSLCGLPHFFLCPTLVKRHKIYFSTSVLNAKFTVFPILILQTR